MQTIELIDTHVHLDDDRFDNDRHRVIKSARESGVCTMVVPATTRDRWRKIKTLAENHTGVHATCGLHPLYVARHCKNDLVILEQQIKENFCVAIGECGLDRHCLKRPDPSQHSDSDTRFATQLFYFEAQLELASQADLPVIVHARQAVEDVILSIKKGPATRGVVHSFNGSLQQAGKLIDLGYRLSFGGAATYPRANKIHRLIRDLPADSILIETDAPDQIGHAHRNLAEHRLHEQCRGNGNDAHPVVNQSVVHRNEPSFLPEVLRTVATLRGESEESIAHQCNENATKLFRLTP